MKQAEFVWAVANLQPATVNEIAETTDLARDSVGATATTAWRKGYVVRRRRDGGTGRAYEYAIAALSPENGETNA